MPTIQWLFHKNGYLLKWSHWFCHVIFTLIVLFRKKYICANFFSFSGCDGQPDDDESAKSLNSNCDNQASSSMMEETTNEHDLQVSFFYFSKKLVFDFPNRNDFTVSQT